MSVVAEETPHLVGPVARSPRRSVPALLARLTHLTSAMPGRLLANRCGTFSCGDDRYSLARFIFDGPPGGGDPIRLGFFAGIHGDEPSGSVGLVQFLNELAQRPELAAGYRIYAYPVCNPTGYEDNTRHSRAGTDLNREFWRASDEPEVDLLEQELWTHEFHGIISLHSDDTSEGVYGFVRGADLSKDLLQPALWAAERFLHRNTRVVIDGFPARQGLIDGGYAGVLSAPLEMQPRPFEITFETPQHAPLHLQVEAHAAALHCVLAEYRTVMSVAQNI